MPLPFLAAALPYLPAALAAGGSLFGLLRGQGQQPQTTQLPNFNPNQQSAFSNLLSQGLQNYNPEAIANRARTDFNQKTIPSIAERFTSMGSGSSLSSPAFASQLGQASAGLEEGLAGLRSNMGLQQLQLGLTPQFENVYQQRQPSALESFSGPAIQALLYYLMGNQSQNGLSSLFGNMGGNQFNYSGSRFANPNYSAPNVGSGNFSQNSALRNLTGGF